MMIELNIYNINDIVKTLQQGTHILNKLRSIIINLMSLPNRFLFMTQTLISIQEKMVVLRRMVKI